MPKPVHVWPPPPAPLRLLPPGTLVTGRSRSGLHGIPGHNGHIFRIGATIENPEFSNAGWQQRVQCLVEKEFFVIDGEFCIVEATDDDIAKFNGLCRHNTFMWKEAIING